LPGLNGGGAKVVRKLDKKVFSLNIRSTFAYYCISELPN